MEICAGNPFCTTAPFFNGTIFLHPGENRDFSPLPLLPPQRFQPKPKSKHWRKEARLQGRKDGRGRGGGGEDAAAVAVAATAIPADIVNLLLFSPKISVCSPPLPCFASLLGDVFVCRGRRGKNAREGGSR